MIDTGSTRAALVLAERVFDSGMEWEALWDVVYRYVAPTRANIFQKKRTPSDVQADVFDSTAIEAADSLTSGVITGMFPFWQSWFDLVPGPAVRTQRERDALREQLDMVRDFVLKHLATNGFYDALEPVILDRIVGGTGYLYCTTAPDGGTRFSCAALSDTRHAEDVHGAALIVVNKKLYTPRAVADEWGDKVPPELIGKDPTVPSMEILRVDSRTVDGAWEQWTILKQGCVALEYRTDRNPRFYPTRWSRVPNWPYGRGPALLCLSDIRAINKLKELTLLNAAKAVAGVYTGVDDGVMNPYTVSFAAGAIIPVASNDPNNPTLRALDNPARFDIAQFSIDNLRESIKAQFLSDQFGPLSRTPRSATEVSARGGIIARRLGLTLLRLREEVVEPIVQRVLDEANRQGLIPPVRIDGAQVSITYSGELASAQRDSDADGLLNFTSVAQQFGQVDPLAALVVDVPSALRRYAELKGIPSEVMRSERQAQQLADQMAQKQQQLAAAQAGGQTAALGQQATGAPA